MTSSNQRSERWLPIPGWEGLYEVSDIGRIRSVDRVIRTSKGQVRRLRGRVLRPGSDRGGYLSVQLCRNGVCEKSMRIHQAVLFAFVGPRPEGTECCHRDDVPTNNTVGNVYWGTKSQNMNDRLRRGWTVPTQTHCLQGHPLEGANLLVHHNGVGDPYLRRRCRQCRRDAYQDRRANRQGAMSA